MSATKKNTCILCDRLHVITEVLILFTPSAVLCLSCSTLLLVHVQKKMYRFIKHCLQHWPLDEVFRYVSQQNFCSDVVTVALLRCMTEFFAFTVLPTL